MNEKMMNYEIAFKEIVMLVPVEDLIAIKQRGGDLKFPMYITGSMKETSLDFLELSERANNCLRRSGYRTIGQLVEGIEGYQDLKSIRSCGNKTISEIMKKLLVYQFCSLSEERKKKFVQELIELNRR